MTCRAGVVLAVLLAAALAGCSQDDDRPAPGPDTAEECLPHPAATGAAQVAEDASPSAEDIVESGATTDVQRSADGSVLLAFEVRSVDDDGVGPARSAWLLCSSAGEQVAVGLGPATATDGGARLDAVPLDEGFLISPAWGTFAPLAADGTVGPSVSPAQEAPPADATQSGDRVLGAQLGPEVAVRPATGEVFTPRLLVQEGDDEYVPGVTPDVWGITADGGLWAQFGGQVRHAEGDRWRRAGSLPEIPGAVSGLVAVVGDRLVALTVDSNLGIVSALHVREAERRGDWDAVPLAALLESAGELVPLGERHVLVPLEEGPAVLDVVAATLTPLETEGELWAGPGGLLRVADDALQRSADGGLTWEPAYS